MMDLSQVSRTAILTLVCRVVASEKKPAEFSDPLAALCLERLISLASPEEKDWILDRRRFYSGFSSHDALAGARRSKAFDQAADRFIAANPGCTLVNLACGFDTRFWRIDRDQCRFFEVDLPGVIALKDEILKDQPGCERIGCSVTDPAWIDQVTGAGNSRVLLLAEGLLCFLPQSDVLQLFQRLADRFVSSQFTFDVVPQKFLHGIWKLLLRLETRINWKLEAAWQSGIRTPAEVETYAPGIKLMQATRGSAGPIITVSVNSD